MKIDGSCTLLNDTAADSNKYVNAEQLYLFSYATSFDSFSLINEQIIIVKNLQIILLDLYIMNNFILFLQYI